MDKNSLRQSAFGDVAVNDLRKELTLRDLTVIYRRRQKLIYSIVAGVAVLAAIYCIVCTRRYEATGSIQILSKSQDGLALETMAGGPPDGDIDPLSANTDIQTQVNILQSDTLALKTIEDLHMEGTEDFKGHWNPISWVMGLFSPSGVPDPSNASLENAPRRRQRALLIFGDHLKVKSLPGTRLIEISYLNPDPKLAAAVVNKLAQALIDYSFQTRFDLTHQAAGWLSGQLADLRQNSEQLQRQVADLQSKSGVYSIGTVDNSGHSQAYSDTLQRLSQATTEVSQAEQNRILRGAILHAALSGDAEMLSGLAGNTMNGAAVNNSLTVVQNLRGQEATYQAQLQQAESKYGPAYPKLAEIRSNVSAIQSSIQQEIERLKSRAQSDYDDAVRTEAETRSQYNALKAQADTLNNNSVNLAIVGQQADQANGLYQALMRKFKEAGVLEGLKGSMIAVVDPGRIPAKPARPNIPVYMGIAIAGAFFLGCCIALVVEAMDDKINSIYDVEKISGGNFVAATPFFPSRTNLALATSAEAPRLDSLDNPQSPFVESARAIRTELFQKDEGDHSRVVLVTSSVPGEGKTTLSANLAVLLAQSGKKVLLIDTDLRLGAMQTALNVPSGPGVGELLTGLSAQPDIRPVNGVANLDALQAGAPSSNPSELLGSSAFRHWLSAWRDKYDYIVLDSAPLLPVTDSLLLAPLSDITLLVVRPGLTEKSQLVRSYQLLNRNGKNQVAAIVNGLQPEEEGYSTYFGYRKPDKYAAKWSRLKIGS